MIYSNSIAIIRTRKDSVVGSHLISTRAYEKANPHQFVYNGYRCSKFDVAETVGGTIVLTLIDTLEFSKVTVTNTIYFENVTSIEIKTHHKV